MMKTPARRVWDVYITFIPAACSLIWRSFHHIQPLLAMSALHVLQLMAQGGVRKEPGRSWIEVDNKVHDFVVEVLLTLKQTRSMLSSGERVRERIEERFVGAWTSWCAGYGCKTNWTRIRRPCGVVRMYAKHVGEGGSHAYLQSGT